MRRARVLGLVAGLALLAGLSQAATSPAAPVVRLAAATSPSASCHVVNGRADARCTPGTATPG